ncbi:DUF4010 domain-containing protein [Ideonella sp. A 288]|uniref:MgtC/SapB family protein n=1 Tax=Ideonella sp. A 288 TaxID=1962181 RepID=UPI000B4B2026|nr:DUF4010 domain-containing protein [Ideonella sp. A 288]
MDLATARNFLIALLIGALVGLEREKRKATEPGPTFGGIRTYTLLALVGATSAWLSRTLDSPWLLAVTLAVVGAAVVASHVLQAREPDSPLGLTSEVAAIAVCLLGAMVVVGDPGLAVALAVVTSALLAFKQPLHSLVRRIDTDDLFAGIKLAIASFIVLPLLPNATVDPWDALNPYTLWLLVIFISALSLLGYVAVRVLGTTYGTAITGLAGGLVSSTATTVSFARTSQTGTDAAQAHALAAGILLSWGVMFARVVVLVLLVNRALLPALAVPCAAMIAATLVLAARHGRLSLPQGTPTSAAAPTAAGEATQVRVSNPFSLTSAIRFGVLFAVVLLGVALAQQHAPGFGVYVVAALAGLVDVDAITLSVARQADTPAALAQAGHAITLAMLSNTLVKCAIVWLQGDGPVRGHIARATALMLGLGVAAMGAAALIGR